MNLLELLRVILDFSEQASVIARSIREDQTLFKLLVEEKKGETKNERFTHDFKTLADVLIQQLLASVVVKKVRVRGGLLEMLPSRCMLVVVMMMVGDRLVVVIMIVGDQLVVVAIMVGIDWLVFPIERFANPFSKVANIRFLSQKMLNVLKHM